MKYEYSGTLCLYWETGFEGSHSPILQDDRGKTTAPGFNPETKKWDGPPMEFHTLEWAVWFKGGEEIEIFAEDGSTLYKGPLTKDRLKAHEAGYVVSFVPKELETKQWINMIARELRATVRTDQPVPAEEKKP